MTSTRYPESLESKVRRYLRARGIKTQAGLLVACSGGPDSTCLLHVLARVVRSGRSIAAVYIDHGIRSPEAIAAEENFVRRQCRGLAAPFYVKRISRGLCERRAEEERRSLEEIAREERYGALSSLLREIQADYLAVGHNKDDQMETLLMRFFQGGDPIGLTGIPQERQGIIRPLLQCRREEVLAYLKAANVGFCTDESNSELRFLRNRIRHVLLPAVREVFPGYSNSLSALARKMSGLEQYLAGEIRRRSPWKPVEEPPGYMSRGEDFIALPGYLRVRMLYRLFNDLLRSIGAERFRIPYRFLAPAMDRRWFFPKRNLLSGYGLKLLWRGDRLFLTPDVVVPLKKGYFNRVSEAGEYRIIGTDLSFIVAKRRDEGGMVPEDSCLRKPLVVRSRRPGDTIVCQGKSKSIKKLFSEWKVPEDRRWMLPLVCDRKGVLAVMGGCLGLPDRQSDRLNLAVVPGEKTCVLSSSMTITFNRRERSPGDGKGE